MVEQKEETPVETPQMESGKLENGVNGSSKPEIPDVEPSDENGIVKSESFDKNLKSSETLDVCEKESSEMIPDATENKMATAGEFPDIQNGESKSEIKAHEKITEVIAPDLTEHSTVASGAEESTEPSVAGSESTEPSVAGSESTEPSVAGSESTVTSSTVADVTEPLVDGAESTEPTVVVVESTEPIVVGVESTEPAVDGVESTEPSAVGVESTESFLVGVEFTEPSAVYVESTEPSAVGVESPLTVAKSTNTSVVESTKPLTVSAESTKPVLVVGEAMNPSVENTTEPLVVEPDTTETSSGVGSESMENSAKITDPSIVGTELTEPSAASGESTEPSAIVTELKEPSEVGAESTNPLLDAGEKNTSPITIIESANIPAFIPDSTKSSASKSLINSALVSSEHSGESKESLILTEKSSEPVSDVTNTTESPKIVQETVTEPSATFTESLLTSSESTKISTDTSSTITSTETSAVVKESTETSILVVKSTEFSTDVSESTKVSNDTLTTEVTKVAAVSETAEVDSEVSKLSPEEITKPPITVPRRVKTMSGSNETDPRIRDSYQETKKEIEDSLTFIKSKLTQSPPVPPNKTKRTSNAPKTEDKEPAPEKMKNPENSDYEPINTTHPDPVYETIPVDDTTLEKYNPKDMTEENGKPKEYSRECIPPVRPTRTRKPESLRVPDWSAPKQNLISYLFSCFVPKKV